MADATRRPVISRAFIAFVAVGGSAALLNVVAGRFFTLFITIEIAVALAYLIAMTYAYLLNRLFVFDGSPQATGSEFGRFVAVNMVALVIVWCVTILLARLIFPAIGFAWHADLIAHAIGVASPIFFSFWAHRVFTFRSGHEWPGAER